MNARQALPTELHSQLALSLKNKVYLNAVITQYLWGSSKPLLFSPQIPKSVMFKSLE